MAWRVFDAVLDDPPMQSWMRLSSKAVHAMIYILLLAIPLMAISGAWLEVHPITLLGNVPSVRCLRRPMTSAARSHRFTPGRETRYCGSRGRMQSRLCTTISFCGMMRCDPCCRNDRARHVSCKSFTHAYRFPSSTMLCHRIRQSWAQARVIECSRLSAAFALLATVAG